MGPVMMMPFLLPFAIPTWIAMQAMIPFAIFFI